MVEVLAVFMAASESNRMTNEQLAQSLLLVSGKRYEEGVISIDDAAIMWQAAKRLTPPTPPDSAHDNRQLAGEE